MALFASCAARKPFAPFQVVPGRPYYMLRSPDKVDTAFPDTLKEFSDVRAGWADLRPGMELKVQQAYFKDLAAKRGVDNYIGLETAQYRADEAGRLQSIAFEPLAARPAAQPSVNAMIAPARRRDRFHRLFFQVVLDRKSGASNAVLLSASTAPQIEKLSEQLLSDAGKVCAPGLKQCTVFPEGCAASLALNVTVNGRPQAVMYGNTVGSLASKAKSFTLLRRYRGRDTPVLFNSADPATLGLPLMPNDRLTVEN